MPNEKQDFVKIARIHSLIESHVLESVLTQRGIAYRVRSFHDSAYDGLFQFQKGWGEVYAPAEHSNEIIEILESIRVGCADESGDPELE